MTTYYAVVEGDPLDNGGDSAVIGGAQHATIEGPDGRSRGQTHLGHEAWCSVCQSAGVIAAGAGISDYLRGWDERLNAMEAVGGDIVLCKCEQPPRVVSVYGRSCSYIDTASTTAAVAVTSFAAASHTTYDEQFTLRDDSGRGLADMYYTIRLPDGELVHGVTDNTGRTGRHATDGSQDLPVYLGHREFT